MRYDDIVKESEEDFTEDDIRKFLDDVNFFAEKERRSSRFWAELYHMSEEDKMKTIENKLEPILAKHGYPKPGTAEYHAFQKEILML